MTRRISSEVLLIAKDGREVSVILEGRIQQDNEGNFQRTHCILTDRIYLPRSKGEAVETDSEISTSKPPVGTETVLIVEDEEAIMNLGKTILERLGYTVLTASTPGKAIRLVREYAGDIQLLIADVVMPEMNGRELTERLTSVKPGLKCLFMSGYTADAIAHHGVLDEGVYFIQKPFSVKKMAEKVRNVLDD